MAKITAVNYLGTQTIFERQVNGLPNHFFVGSKVSLTKHLIQAASLVNGSTGIIKEFFMLNMNR